MLILLMITTQLLPSILNQPRVQVTIILEDMILVRSGNVVEWQNLEMTSGSIALKGMKLSGLTLTEETTASHALEVRSWD